jgi:uncharacterized repeat protein (TIGR03803 family)
MQNKFLRRMLFLVMIVPFVVATVPWIAASAHTFKVLYTFCAANQCTDGRQPADNLVVDQAGNLYGTTVQGGANEKGTVFELVANPQKTAWTYQILYSFGQQTNCGDGCFPYGIIMDVSGNLYGAALSSDTAEGLIYELVPNSQRTQWTLVVLYDFCKLEGCPDGAGPSFTLSYAGQANGGLYDGTSPLYGMTQVGGTGRYCSAPRGCGTVFELVPVGAQWQQATLYNFCSRMSCADGLLPSGSLTADAFGNLFGTTLCGGRHTLKSCGVNNVAYGGTLFELSASGSGKTPWTETVLYAFCGRAGCADGESPVAVSLAANGELFGVTQIGGRSCEKFTRTCGVAFKFSPDAVPKYSGIYRFCKLADCADGYYPNAPMIFDSSGNLYGSTSYGGGNDIDHTDDGGGTVFELGSSLNVLYSFCAEPGCADGAYPSAVVMDGSGDLFGTTITGGNVYGGGTVFEITP